MTVQIGVNESLERVEKRRLSLQSQFDGDFSIAQKNRWGQFATPPALAWDMLMLAARHSEPHGLIRFLDPAVGTGVFFSALLRVFGRDRIQDAVGFEVDDRIARTCKELWGPFGFRVRCEDFSRAAQPTTELERFNLIVCNPPYVRHHHLGHEAKGRLKRVVFDRLALSVSGLAGFYCYFMLLADAWLAERGTALWLVPAEFLDVNYGSALREYLSSRVALRCIHRFNPENVQFSDALVSSAVVVYQKDQIVPGDRIDLCGGGSLLQPSHSTRVSAAELVRAHKWGALAAGRIHEAWRTRHHCGSSITLGNLFDIKRGIATGANRFFILTARRAREIGLPEQFLLPILPSPRYITTDRIEPDEAGWPSGLARLVLLSCDLPRHTVRQLYPALDAYLKLGEESGITRRYLMRTREPWYRQEVRPPTGILCTYMGRAKPGARTFRFLRNYTEATAPNVYLMLYPKTVALEIEQSRPAFIDRVFFALQQSSDEELFNEGRVYGGGLKKVEPRELSRLQLTLEDTDSSVLRARTKSVQLDLFPSGE